MFSSIYYLAYTFISKDFYLKTFSNNLNLFSIMTELSKLDFTKNHNSIFNIPINRINKTKYKKKIRLYK